MFAFKAGLGRFEQIRKNIKMKGKREVPRGVRNSKVRRQDKFRRCIYMWSWTEMLTTYLKQEYTSFIWFLAFHSFWLLVSNWKYVYQQAKSDVINKVAHSGIEPEISINQSPYALPTKLFRLMRVRGLIYIYMMSVFSSMRGCAMYINISIKQKILALVKIEKKIIFTYTRSYKLFIINCDACMKQLRI